MRCLCLGDRVAQAPVRVTGQCYGWHAFTDTILLSGWPAAARSLIHICLQHWVHSPRKYVTCICTELPPRSLWLWHQRYDMIKNNILCLIYQELLLYPPKLVTEHPRKGYIWISTFQFIMLKQVCPSSSIKNPRARRNSWVSILSPKTKQPAWRPVMSLALPGSTRGLQRERGREYQPGSRWVVGVQSGD